MDTLSPGIVARRRCASFILEDGASPNRQSSPGPGGRRKSINGLSPRSPLTALTNNSRNNSPQRLGNSSPGTKPASGGGGKSPAPRSPFSAHASPQRAHPRHRRSSTGSIDVLAGFARMAAAAASKHDSPNWQSPAPSLKRLVPSDAAERASPAAGSPSKTTPVVPDRSSSGSSNNRRSNNNHNDGGDDAAAAAAAATATPGSPTPGNSPAVPKRPAAPVSPADAANLRNLLARSPFGQAGGHSSNKHAANLRRNLLRRKHHTVQQASASSSTTAMPPASMASGAAAAFAPAQTQDLASPGAVEDETAQTTPCRSDQAGGYAATVTATATATAATAATGTGNAAKLSPLQWQSPCLNRVLHSPEFVASVGAAAAAAGGTGRPCTAASAGTSPTVANAATTTVATKAPMPLFDTASPVLEAPPRIVCERRVKSNSHVDTPSPSAPARVAHSLRAVDTLPSFRTLPNLGFEPDSDLAPGALKALAQDIAESEQQCAHAWAAYLGSHGAEGPTRSSRTTASSSSSSSNSSSSSSSSSGGRGGASDASVQNRTTTANGQNDEEAEEEHPQAKDDDEEEEENDVQEDDEEEATAARICGLPRSDEWLETLVKTVGVPASARGAVWSRWSGALAKRRAHRPNYYDCLVNQIQEEPVYEHFTIEVDLLRTCPDHWFFSAASEFADRYPHRGFDRAAAGGGLVVLQRVLTAYALRNTAIGYVQGMNYLAAFLLLVTGDETETFWLFATLLEDIFPGYFGQELAGFQLDSQVLQNYMAKGLPELCRSMKATNIPVDFVIPKWFLCLFFNTFHPYQVARVWDVLFFAPRAAKATVVQLALGIMALKEPALTRAAADDDIGELSAILQDVSDCRGQFRDVMQSAQGRFGAVTPALLADLRVRAAEALAARKAKRDAYINEQRRKLDAAAAAKLPQAQAQPAAGAAAGAGGGGGGSGDAGAGCGKRKAGGMMSPAVGGGDTRRRSSGGTPAVGAAGRAAAGEALEGACVVPGDLQAQYSMYQQSLGDAAGGASVAKKSASSLLTNLQFVPPMLGSSGVGYDGGGGGGGGKTGSNRKKKKNVFRTIRDACSLRSRIDDCMQQRRRGGGGERGGTPRSTSGGGSAPATPAAGAAFGTPTAADADRLVCAAASPPGIEMTPTPTHRRSRPANFGAGDCDDNPAGDNHDAAAGGGGASESAGAGAADR